MHNILLVFLLAALPPLTASAEERMAALKNIWAAISVPEP